MRWLNNSWFQPKKKKKMTNEEILKKAIEKAVGNGWDRFGYSKDGDGWEVYGGHSIDDPTLHITYTGELGTQLLKVFSYQVVIFSHDFAKAFWGDGGRCIYCNEPMWGFHPNPCPLASNKPTKTLWEFHLQQMVLEPKPLKYLERFL